jgi:hypothetical protein
MTNLPKLKQDYIPYPKAMQLLFERLKSTREEMALWILLGNENGSDGINAYLNVELESPTRFYYYHFDETNYLSTLQYCWFIKSEIESFQPKERYLTGKDLITRWSKYSYVDPINFIQAKITESRLFDFHPVKGFTKASNGIGFPPLEEGLFQCSLIEMIEASDLSNVTIENTIPKSSHQSKQIHQEQLILDTINRLNLKAKELPLNKPGKSGVKLDVRNQLKKALSVSAFDKAWERLRKSGEIKN